MRHLVTIMALSPGQVLAEDHHPHWRIIQDVSCHLPIQIVEDFRGGDTVPAEEWSVITTFMIAFAASNDIGVDEAYETMWYRCSVDGNLSFVEIARQYRQFIDALKAAESELSCRRQLSEAPSC